MELKNSVIQLLNHNISSKGVPRSVGIQLSVALADLALQVLEWKNVVAEMVDTFGGSSDSLPSLLEFLKVLPEELLSPRHTLLTDEEFSMRSEELLDQNSAQVVTLLLHYAFHSSDSGSGTATPASIASQSATTSSNLTVHLDGETRAVLYECLNSWLKEISLEDFLNTPLLDVLFAGLEEDETFDAAVECIVSIIKETRDTTSLDIISAIYPRVVQLRPLVIESKDDSSKLIGLTKMFSEAGESWHVLIAQSPNDFLELIESIIDCTSVDEDLDAISYTFYFWYSLKQMLVLERYKNSRSILGNVYLRLIGIIIERLKYPPGDENSDLFGGNREEEEKFRSFRHDIGDVLKDCCQVVGSSQALGESYKALTSSLAAHASWQSIEAPLFSVRAMGQVVDLDENEVLPNIMKLLFSLPDNNKIRYTVTLVLGRYTEWTARHPEYLDFQLDYIIKGFDRNDSDVSKAASQALMYFCQDCRDMLAKYIEQLHPFYEQMLNILDMQSLYQVTEGIAHIIRSQPIDSILIVLQHFSKPIVDRLIDLTGREGSDEVYRSIADIIELLTIFVRNVRPSNTTNGKLAPGAIHPTTQFVFDVFPIVPPLLKAHGTSSFVAERCSKFTKFCLHSCGAALEPILPAIGNILASEFERTKFGCYLWVSGAVVTEFSLPDEERDTPLTNSVNVEQTKKVIWEFCKHQSYSFFRILSGSDPKDYPDLIEDFFHLAGDILMYYPFEALTSDWIGASFQAALAGLTLEQFEPLTATLHFLLDLFAYGGEQAPSSSVIPGGKIPAEIRSVVSSLAAEQGEALTSRIITGILFSYPRDVITDASSLLLSAYRLSSGNETIRWLSNTLDALPAGGLSPDEKSKLLQRISTSMESQDFKRVRSILRDFTTLYGRRNLTPRNAGINTVSASSFSFSG
ncbi:Mtr10p [Sugiyamaella lignohabitans]|uniref:Mtr10p n=1 Tax=Sugiyamaella lignohabitans TaxID=796027 RepID=A0A167FS47_9ASCO|nr:Mtr10p [Sugiyamaella lignohabitans]ANB15633.1 Mtr10p [Sugiyamaella lignohabitans]